LAIVSYYLNSSPDFQGPFLGISIYTCVVLWVCKVPFPAEFHLTFQLSLTTHISSCPQESLPHHSSPKASLKQWFRWCPFYSHLFLFPHLGHSKPCCPSPASSAPAVSYNQFGKSSLQGHCSAAMLCLTFPLGYIPPSFNSLTLSTKPRTTPLPPHHLPLFQPLLSLLILVIHDSRSPLLSEISRVQGSLPLWILAVSWVLTHTWHRGCSAKTLHQWAYLFSVWALRIWKIKWFV
jgi:hypothetical protein